MGAALPLAIRIPPFGNIHAVAIGKPEVPIGGQGGASGGQGVQAIANLVAGDGEVYAVNRLAFGIGKSGSIDTDDAAVAVDEGAAAVARVEGGISLEVVRVFKGSVK